MTATPQGTDYTRGSRLQRGLRKNQWIRTKLHDITNYDAALPGEKGAVMYVLPVFNLNCIIFDWEAPSGVQPTSSRGFAPCNLALGRRVQVSSTGGTSDTGVQAITTTLLLPALTDIRSWVCYGDLEKADIVEVPLGSGRFYYVRNVEDCGKGFTNEHRVAYLLATFDFGTWPTPIP